jgi:proteasome alpha subunit
LSGQFYVSPEQLMKDRADFARKGIARGRSLIAAEYDNGIALVASNPSNTLSKLAEIYDRMAFAAVGKYNEFESLKIAGIRHADLKGFSYSRRDVTARSLANAYAQTLGQVFTHETKPFEVEILVAEIAEDPGGINQMYRILYDGTVMDEHGFAVLGGQTDPIVAQMSRTHNVGDDRDTVVRTCAIALAGESAPSAKQLEVCVLDHGNSPRTFQRLTFDEVDQILSAATPHIAADVEPGSGLANEDIDPSGRAGAPEGDSETPGPGDDEQG